MSKELTLKNNSWLKPFDAWDNTFQSFFNFGDDLFKNWITNYNRPNSYPYDMYEVEDSVVIEVPLAGYMKEDIKVKLKNDTLIIDVDEKKRDERFIINKIKHSHVSMAFDLMGVVDVDKVEVKFENGLLTLNLPKNKKGSDEVKNIEIK